MRLKLWDKKEDIYTIGQEMGTGKSRFTAEEWIERNQWIKKPDAKVIISDGTINGMITWEFEQTKSQYKSLGANITDDMTDDEVLRAIEEFRDNPPVDNTPTSEERIAAALEAQVMLSEPDAIMTMSLDDELNPTDIIIGSSPSYERIKRNYKTGLWGESLLEVAVGKGMITMDEKVAIIG